MSLLKFVSSSAFSENMIRHKYARRRFPVNDAWNGSMNMQVSYINVTCYTRHYTSVVHTCLSKIGCDDVVGPEGMEKFCEDIGVEPENVSPFFIFVFVFC